MERTLAEKLPESALGNDIINVPKDVTKEAEKEDHLMRPYDPKSHSEYIELKRFEIEQANESLERKLRQENAKKAFIFSSRWAILLHLLFYYTEQAHRINSLFYRKPSFYLLLEL